MSLGLVGRKIGMTRIFADDGTSIPVTVVDVADNRVTQVKTPENDGYAAIQVAYGERRASRVNKPAAGHFAKAGVQAGSILKEFRLDNINDFKAGDNLKVDAIFSEGQKVDVSGTSIGKGFQGGIKRHNFSSQRASHGNSVSYNAPGSIGQAQDPGRVFPGKRMAGHLGAEKVTQQGLTIVRVDVNRQLLLIKGAIPGAKGGNVIVKPSSKK